MNKMHGIIAVTVTPFKEDGSIDYDAAAKQVEWLIDSGVHGLLPLGATGEFASLSLAERKEYAEFFMKKVNGRVPVMIGAVSSNVAETIEIAKHAASLNAASVMILPPPGLHPEQEEIYGLYKYVSENVTLPVAIYNNPGSSGVDIAPETMARIAELPHMEYMKESTGDIKRLTRMVDEHGEKVTILCGCENLAYESFVMGAKGWICVCANIAPKLCVELYSSVVEKNDLAGGRKVYRKMLPFLRLLEDTGELWQIAKYGQQKQGIGNGVLRLPRGPLSAENKAALDSLMAGGDIA